MTAVAVAAAILGLPILALVIFNGVMGRKAEALVPPVGRFITVDGVRLHYVDTGSGPVVLMIHGLASQLQTFTYAIASRLEDRYRLIIVDRPGSGYSRPAPEATLRAQAATMSGFLRALDITQALVVGHSLGGAVALALALDSPAQVAGLALLAPATRPEDDVPETFRRMAIHSDIVRWIIGWTLATPFGMRAGPRILQNLFAPDPVPADFGTRAGSLLSLRPANFRNASRDLVEAGGELKAYAARYDRITAPVGILFGAGDRILDYRHHGQALQRQIPDLVFEVIEDGGHMTPISSPDRSADFIDRMAEKAALRERAVPA